MSKNLIKLVTGNKSRIDVNEVNIATNLENITKIDTVTSTDFVNSSVIVDKDIITNMSTNNLDSQMITVSGDKVTATQLLVNGNLGNSYTSAGTTLAFALEPNGAISQISDFSNSFQVVALNTANKYYTRLSEGNNTQDGRIKIEFEASSFQVIGAGDSNTKSFLWTPDETNNANIGFVENDDVGSHNVDVFYTVEILPTSILFSKTIGELDVIFANYFENTVTSEETIIAEGKNIFNQEQSNFELGNINSDGELITSPSGTRLRSKLFEAIESSTVYARNQSHIDIPNKLGFINAVYYDDNFISLGRQDIFGAVSFTSLANAKFVKWVLGVANDSGATILDTLNETNLQIEKGNSVTSFKAYKPNRLSMNEFVTIPLEDKGRIRYEVSTIGFANKTYNSPDEMRANAEKLSNGIATINDNLPASHGYEVTQTDISIIDKDILVLDDKFITRNIEVTGDSITATNESAIINGDTVTGWTDNTGLTLSGDFFKMGNSTGFPPNSDVSVNSNDTYYVKLIGFKTGTDLANSIKINFAPLTGASIDGSSTTFDLTDDVKIHSGKLVLSASNNGIRLYETSGVIVEQFIKDIMIINLTTSGLVNKPTSELDNIFSNYFENTVTSEETIIAEGKNIFDRDNINNNKVIDSNGDLITDNSFFVTDLIRVLPERDYVASKIALVVGSNTRVSQFDVNRNRIDTVTIPVSGNGGGHVKKTTSSNTVFLQFTSSQAFLNTFQVELDKVTEFRTYVRATAPFNNFASIPLDNNGRLSYEVNTIGHINKTYAVPKDIRSNITSLSRGVATAMNHLESVNETIIANKEVAYGERILTGSATNNSNETIIPKADLPIGQFKFRITSTTDNASIPIGLSGGILSLKVLANGTTTSSGAIIGVHSISDTTNLSDTGVFEVEIIKTANKIIMKSMGGFVEQSNYVIAIVNTNNSSNLSNIIVSVVGTGGVNFNWELIKL